MSGSRFELPELPRRVDDLEKIAPALRDCYVSDAAGGFALSPAAAEAQAEFEAECARIEAETAERMAEQEAARARIDRTLVRLEVSRAVREAGVLSDLQDAAGALIQREPLAVEWGEAPAVVVDAPYGRIGISDAVADWLRTEAGSPYRPKAQWPAEPGALTMAVRRLRERDR